MGYESKAYVVDYHKKVNYASTICMMDLSKMGWGSTYYNIFKNPVDYEVYLENGDEPCKEDRCGDPIKDAPIRDVIGWLAQEIQKEDYRRLKPFLSMLIGFDLSEWDDLRVIHYGY